MNNLLISFGLVFALLLGFACSQAIVAPVAAPVPDQIVLMDTGETISLRDVEVTPSTSSYEFVGQTYKKDIATFDWFTLPFGDNAFTVLAKQETNKIGSNTTPAVVIDDDGIHAEKATQDKSVVGGERSTSVIDWVKKLFSDIGNMWVLLLIGAACLFVLPIFFPILAPVCASVLGFIHKAFDWVVSLIGRFVDGLKLKIETTKVVKEQLKNPADDVTKL